jgi:hypothetical protein
MPNLLESVAASYRTDLYTTNFFDADPDGDESRAGDGWYFQIDGETGWNGAWHSEDEAEKEAGKALATGESRDAVADLVASGYILASISADDAESFLGKFDERWFSITTSKDRIEMTERFPAGGRTTRTVFAVEPSDDDPVIGNFRNAVRSAINSVTAAVYGLETTNEPRPADHAP